MKYVMHKDKTIDLPWHRACIARVADLIDDHICHNKGESWLARSAASVWWWAIKTKE